MQNASDSPAAKPARKSSPSKTSDKADGSKLPAAGNAVPPVPQPLPQITSGAAPASAATSGSVTGTAAAGGTNSISGTPASAAGDLATSGTTASNSTQLPVATDPADLKGAGGAVQANAASAAAASAAAASADAADETDDTDDTAPGGAAVVSGKNSTAAEPDASAATTVSAVAKAAASQTPTVQPAVAHQFRNAATTVSSSAAPAGAAADAVVTGAGAIGTADPAASPDPTSAVVAQTSADAAPPPAPAVGAAGPGDTPDAATALAAAGASATAAVASSAARVITALAASTALDEKHVRGGADASAPATATPGIDGSAGAAAQAASGTLAQSTDAASTTMKVSASVDSNDFSQGVANQISTMVDKNITSAKLQVNPPSLGPIEVRISVQGGHAQVWMVSHSAVTRDALQSSTPTLREMLSGQGFGQVSVDISQRSFQERTPNTPTYEWNADAARSNGAAAVSTVGSTARAANGVLDAYA